MGWRIGLPAPDRCDAEHTARADVTSRTWFECLAAGEAGRHGVRKYRPRRFPHGVPGLVTWQRGWLRRVRPRSCPAEVEAGQCDVAHFSLRHRPETGHA